MERKKLEIPCRCILLERKCNLPVTRYVRWSVGWLVGLLHFHGPNIYFLSHQKLNGTMQKKKDANSAESATKRLGGHQPRISLGREGGGASLMLIPNKL